MKPYTVILCRHMYKLDFYGVGESICLRQDSLAFYPKGNFASGTVAHNRGQTDGLIIGNGPSTSVIMYRWSWFLANISSERWQPWSLANVLTLGSYSLSEMAQLRGKKAAAQQWATLHMMVPLSCLKYMNFSVIHSTVDLRIPPEYPRSEGEVSSMLWHLARTEDRVRLPLLWVQVCLDPAVPCPFFTRNLQCPSPWKVAAPTAQTK